MDDYEKIFNFQNLLKAHKKARRGKQGKREVIEFELNLAQNLCTLSEELKNRTYRILDEIDIVVLVLDARNDSLTDEEEAFIKLVVERKLPHIIIQNHVDEAKAHSYKEIPSDEQLIYLDATSDDMSSVKEALIKLLPQIKEKEPVFYGDFDDSFDGEVEIQNDGHFFIEVTGRRAQSDVEVVIK